MDRASSFNHLLWGRARGKRRSKLSESPGTMAAAWGVFHPQHTHQHFFSQRPTSLWDVSVASVGCQGDKSQIKPVLAQAWGYPVLGTQCHPAQDRTTSARPGRGWLTFPRLAEAPVPDAVGFAGVLACRGTQSLAAPSHQHASGCCSRGARPPLGATRTLAPTSLLRLDLLLRLLQDAFDGVVGAGLRRPDPRRDAT